MRGRPRAGDGPLAVGRRPRSPRALALTALALAAPAAGAAGCGGTDAGPGGGDRAPELTLLFRVDSLSGPESVAWDSARNRWLVTNVGEGEGGGGTGFVTAIPEGGGEPVLRAYDGTTPGLRLDGPRGIAVRGDRAYIADLDRVVALDLAGDSVLWARELSAGRSLDDVVLAPAGIPLRGVYVSDPGEDAIWRVEEDGSGVRRLGAAGSLRGPAGLLAEGNGADGAARILAAGREGAVLALGADSSVTLLAGSPEFGSLEGLQPSPDGGLLVSDRSTGRIHHLRRRDGGVWRAGVAWITGLDHPADLLVRDSVLVLPELGADRVTFYRIGGG